MTTSSPLPEQLPSVAAFVRVAQHASFAGAAAELGISASELSQTVRELEARMGVRLLERAPHRVSVTEAGARLLQRVRPALEQFGAAFDEIEDLRGRPSHSLRLNLPHMATSALIAPLLGEFNRAYPGIRLEITTDGGSVTDGYDAVIHLGERPVQEASAVRISRAQRIVVVGSPAYFERHPRPRVPADLHNHACLRFRFADGGVYRWEFSAPRRHGGEDFEIDVDGPLVANDIDLAIAAAKQGVGLAHTLERSVRRELESGELECVLENWCPTFSGFFLYHPNHPQLPLQLRVFIDFLRTHSSAFWAASAHRLSDCTPAAADARKHG